jgi:predicted anti-sigma-YlaC factor YlaD
MLTCDECQSQLLAYGNGELRPSLRRLVTRHLNQCDICYARYCQQADLERDLTLYVPLMGQESKPRLDQMWANIQSNMTQSRPPSNHFQARYGLVAAIVALMFIVPLTMGNQNLTLAAPPTQPAPATVQLTPSGTESITRVVAMTTPYTPEAGQPVLKPLPINTPAVSRTYDNNH